MHNSAHMCLATDAMNVAAWAPFQMIWMVTTGKTLLPGADPASPADQRLTRTEALRHYTTECAWFMDQEGRLGWLQPGYHGDLIVLSDDYFAVPDDAVKDLKSVMTVVDGRIVHDDGSLAVGKRPRPRSSATSAARSTRRSSLTLGAPASFGAFTPGLAKEYTAMTTANVVSSAGDATLTYSDPGHLTNGAFSLLQPLRVALSKSSWTGPAANDLVTINFKQAIGANEPIRTGSYGKTLTFTLSTTSP